MENIEKIEQIKDGLRGIYDFADIPIIPLRGLVVFPNMNLHFDVGRKKSISALKSAMNKDQKIFLVAQRDASVDNPQIEDMYEMGVVCEIKQMIKIPNSSNFRVIVQGLMRADLVTVFQQTPFISGVVDIIDENSVEPDSKDKAYIRVLKKEFERYASKISKISNEVISHIISINDIGELCDYICSNTFFDFSDKQKILETVNPQKRIQKLLVLLKNENETIDIQVEIQEKVQKEIDQNQREYYLREEMRVIAEQLGDGENVLEEADRYRKEIDSKKCSDEIKDKLFAECDKLAKMPQGSHEATVVRTYLDKCLEIPFGTYTKNSISLEGQGVFLIRTITALIRLKPGLLNPLRFTSAIPITQGR